MESWGCEFLEFENYLDPTPEEKELTLPLDLVWNLVDKNYIANIQIKDAWYIQKLKKDINKNGLYKKLLIYSAPNGLLLGDGNHRLCALKELEYKEVPVEIKKSEHRIKKGGVPYFNVVKELLEDYGRSRQKSKRSL